MSSRAMRGCGRAVSTFSNPAPSWNYYPVTLSNYHAARCRATVPGSLRPGEACAGMRRRRSIPAASVALRRQRYPEQAGGEPSACAVAQGYLLRREISSDSAMRSASMARSPSPRRSRACLSSLRELPDGLCEPERSGTGPVFLDEVGLEGCRDFIGRLQRVVDGQVPRSVVNHEASIAHQLASGSAPAHCPVAVPIRRLPGGGSYATSSSKVACDATRCVTTAPLPPPHRREYPQVRSGFSAPGRIRTRDPLLRRQECQSEMLPDGIPCGNWIAICRDAIKQCLHRGRSSVCTSESCESYAVWVSRYQNPR